MQNRFASVTANKMKVVFYLLYYLFVPNQNSHKNITIEKRFL